MAKGMTMKALLTLDAKQFQAGISKVQQQIGSIANAFKGAFAVGSVAMFGRSLVEFTKNYEDAMARVKAVSNANTRDMKMMNDEALRLGATTRYTATQVAETLEVLTRNGFSASKATAVLADTLKLAQANAVGLADAGNMITNTLNMFGLSVKEVQRVNDVMSSIASNTATNLQDFYDALVNAAPMAHALGISIEETAAALGSLAQRGIKGADAGTQLRMALQKMVDPSAMKKMKQLGIEIDENVIKTEGLAGVLKKLSDANLSVSQLNEIFTVRSSKSILQLVGAVDEFNQILEITQNSAGTTSRMFLEGVGSVRKELDILKSVWENLLISLGTATSGPIKALIKGLQNFITAFKSVGGTITNIATVIGLAFIGKIGQVSKFFTTLGNLLRVNALQAQLTAKEVVAADIEKEIADNHYTGTALKNAKLRLTAAKKEVTQMRATVNAANALRASLAAIGKGVAIGALLVLFDQLIAKAIASGQAMRDANKAINEAGKNSENLQAKLGLIKEMIGDGSDKESLVGAVNEAKATFSEFSEAINQAYQQAAKTGNYEKLKKVLEDIAQLQTTVMAQKANQELVDATRDSFKTSIRTRDDNTSRQIRGGLKDQGYTKEGIDAVYGQIVDIIIRNNKNLAKATKELTILFNQLGISTKEMDLEKWIKDITPKDVAGFWSPLTGKRYNSPYTNAVNAYNRQQDLVKQQGKEENDVKWQTAIDKYYAATAEAAIAYKVGSEDYKEAMRDAAADLKNGVEDMLSSLDWSKRAEYDEIQQKWGGKQRTQRTALDDSGSSSSKKKTDWDKFTDTLDDYNKQMTALKSQLDNNAISQRDYDAALMKLRQDTWMTIAAMDKLDEKMKKLSQPQKDVIKDVEDNFPKQGDVGNALVEAADALKKYADKQEEIKTARQNGSYENIDDYLDDLKKLDDETWKNISSLKGLDQALALMPESLKKLYEKLLQNVAANRNQAKEEQKIEIESYQVPPKFQYKTEEEYNTKSEDYSELVKVMRDYLKRVSQLKTENEKGNLSTEDLQKELDKLDEMTQASLLGFRNLNEIVGVLPSSYKDAAKKLMESGPKSMDELWDKRAFIAVMADYSTKAAELMRKKADGIIDDNTYNTEMDKLVDETGKSLLSFKSLDAIIELLPPAIRDVYRELRQLYNTLHDVNENDGNNDNRDNNKLPTPKSEQEAAPVVDVKPIVSVDVNINEKELGKKIGENATVDVKVEVNNENESQTNPEVEKILKDIDRAIKGDKQFKIESDIEDQELKLKVKLDNIDIIQKQMEQLQSDIASGNYSGTIEMATKQLEELRDALIQARDEAKNMNDKLLISKGIEKLNSDIENLKTSAVDNISNIASAFDRVIDGIEAIYEAFGEEIELEGLKKAMAAINGVIQILEALHTVIKMVQVADEIATRKKVANSAQEVASNLEVAGSEMTKAGATASAAAAAGGESVASVPYVGPILAIAAIASIVAAMIGAFSSLKRFKDGGIINGPTTGDRTLVRAQGGEMILNRAQQSRLFKAIDTGNLGGGPVEFIIRGDTLVGILKNHNRKWGR